MSTKLFDLPIGPYTDLFQYWLSLKVDGALPTIQSFDLLAISALIPNIMLFDIEDNRVFVRFVGGKIVSEIGHDTTGFYIDEQPNFEAVAGRSLSFAKTGEPCFLSDLPITWTSQKYKTYKTLALPATDATGTVKRIIFLMKFG